MTNIFVAIIKMIRKMAEVRKYSATKSGGDKKWAKSSDVQETEEDHEFGPKATLAAVDASHRPPGSALGGQDTVTSGIHPTMLKKLLGSGVLPGANITSSHASSNPGSAQTILFDFASAGAANPSRDRVRRHRPPSMSDFDSTLPEFKNHSTGCATSTADSHRQECVECIFKVRLSIGS